MMVHGALQFLCRALPVLLALEAAAADPASGAAEAGAMRTLGSVHIDLPTRSLLVTGRVNQVSGLVEYLAVGAEGKTHESILVVEATPSDVHAGLLLLGLRPGGGVTEQGQGKPFGPLVDVRIEWEEDGKTRGLPAEHAYLDGASTNLLAVSGWVFTGSAIQDGRYMADVGHSLAANHWDPWAVLNLAQDVGASDERLVAYENDLPLLDYPVVLRLTPRAVPAPDATP